MKLERKICLEHLYLIIQLSFTAISLKVEGVCSPIFRQRPAEKPKNVVTPIFHHSTLFVEHKTQTNKQTKNNSSFFLTDKTVKSSEFTNF